MPPDYEAISERSRAVWSRGDYAPLAELLMPAAEALVDACAISAGQEVLDVAAGTGNVAIAAAREGAAVVACDLAPGMVERGRARAEEEGVEVEWVEADAQALPFEDERFECVASAFGAVLAPQPEVVARELFRVVRPGNTVGLASWTPDSLPARLFELHARYLPRPEGVPAPSEWGDEATARARLEGLAGTVEVERRTIRWQLGSVAELLDRLGGAGPGVAMRDALEPGALERMRAESAGLVEEANEATDGSLAVGADYLLVVARRRG